MSRVYDALCQSQRDRNLSPEFLNLDTFEPDPPALEASPSLLPETAPAFCPQALPESRLVVLSNGSMLGSETFRLLRARLRHIQEREAIGKVVITSSVPEEGKTLVAMNLAISLAKDTSQKILLLEGDVHKPAVAERIGLSRRPGLSEWLLSDQPINQYLYRTEGLQLWILAAGMSHQHPLPSFHPARFAEALVQLGGTFDWIIIDAPPLLPLADVNFWAKHADGVLLVVRQGKSPRHLLQKGLETLDHPRLLGVVFNDVGQAERAYYTRYYSEK